MANNFEERRERPLVGPRANERGEKEKGIYELRTQENHPLYHALFSTADPANADKYAVQRAKSQFGILAETFPSEVKALEGKSLDEVREALENLQARLEQRQAA